MQLGVMVGHDGGRGRGMEELASLAVHAEDIGAATFWVPEHVVFLSGAISRYPYNETGELDLGRRPGVYDPLVALAFVAARTHRVRLATGILILPQREPVTLAQQVVAVDHASAGRLDLGIGVGWLREEFAALGVPWARRGARTDEYVRALRLLWQDDVCTFDGEFVNFQDVQAWPKPVQERVPILVGGNTEPALRRAARLGDGWFGFGLGVDEVRTCLDTLWAGCEQAGRDRSEVGTRVGINWNGDVEVLERLFDALGTLGVDELAVTLAVRGVDPHSLLDQLGDSLQRVR